MRPDPLTDHNVHRFIALRGTCTNRQVADHFKVDLPTSVRFLIGMVEDGRLDQNVPGAGESLTWRAR